MKNHKGEEMNFMLKKELLKIRCEMETTMPAVKRIAELEAELEQVKRVKDIYKGYLLTIANVNAMDYEYNRWARTALQEAKEVEDAN